MKLLPRNELLQTSRVDHADWNYRPFLGALIRYRYQLVLALLPMVAVHRLLEVGYGSGIFMPELARRCDELYGIDLHEQPETVGAILNSHDVRATLSSQDVARTNFPSEFFDIEVAASTLEFVERIEEASSELARILGPSGRLIAVMPRKHALLDFALRLVTGEDARRDYGERREQVLPALLQHFRINRTRTFAPVYQAYEFVTR